MLPLESTLSSIAPEDVAPTLVLDDDSDAAPAPALRLEQDVLGQIMNLSNEMQAEEVDLNRLLPLLVKQAADMLACEITWIGLFDPDSNDLSIVTAYGARHPDFAGMQVSYGEGLGGVALRRGMTLVVSDYSRYEHVTPASVRETIETEGIVSLMCAPMKHGNDFVGVLYAGHRRRTRFGSDHISLLTMLAAHASVAVRNGRMYQALLEKTELLEKNSSAQQRLNEAATSGGLDEIVGELASLVGRGLLLEQEEALPFALRKDPDRGTEEDPSSQVAAIVPVLLANRAVGYLTVFGEGEPTVLEHNILAHGASVIALELMRHEAANKVESELRGELLEVLLERGAQPSNGTLGRAQRLGIELDQPHQILVVESRDGRDSVLEDIERRISAVRFGQRAGVLVTRRDGQLIAAVFSGAEQAEALADHVLERAEDGGVGVGISAMRVGRFAKSRREAAACCALAKNSGEDSSIVFYESLGPLAFILDSRDTEHARDHVVDRLSALEEYDRAHGSELIATLRAFLEEDGRHRSVAARCQIHTSTVKYRLGRIAEISGEDLSLARTRFELWLAIQMWDLFSLVGIDLIVEPAGGDTLV